MKTWQSRILVSALGGGSLLALFAAAACKSSTPAGATPDGSAPEDGSAPGDGSTPDGGATCTPGTTMCVVLDAAPPPTDGTKPIPVQDCIAAAARAILTVEQQVGALGQTAATDPNVKAVAQQMAADFGASLAELDAKSVSLGINKIDCPDKEAATGLVQPAFMQLQALTGAAFDQQFVSLEGAVLQQVLDFYNDELIANANSGTFKTILRNERWRFAADGGVAVLKLFAPDASCPLPALANGATPTCVGVVAEMMGVESLGPASEGGAAESGSTAEAGAPDAGGGG